MTEEVTLMLAVGDGPVLSEYLALEGFLVLLQAAEVGLEGAVDAGANPAAADDALDVVKRLQFVARRARGQSG